MVNWKSKAMVVWLTTAHSHRRSMCIPTDDLRASQTRLPAEPNIESLDVIVDQTTKLSMLKTHVTLFRHAILLFFDFVLVRNPVLFISTVVPYDEATLLLP